ncbi:LuxR C-terminal-related transcriptional regulator [Serratia sp. L9]|uniref:LuxR C-terminal-related transcriptional regulator n=1 Tax=Serratia sp. L9 TaxID=3423946 RepID=UPI003D66A9B4
MNFSVSRNELTMTNTILKEKKSATYNRVKGISMTPCEISVFDSVMKGVSLTTLACINGRSIKTLNHHKRNLMRKLGVITNMELYRLAKHDLRI